MTDENITTPSETVTTDASGSFTAAVVGETPLLPVAGGPFFDNFNVTIQGVINTYPLQYTDS